MKMNPVASASHIQLLQRSSIFPWSITLLQGEVAGVLSCWYLAAMGG